jgi:disulfide oxidoreductase YuzD
MMINFKTYGARMGCASCVGAPTDYETFEWLKSALRRKFPITRIDFEYINIEDGTIESVNDIENLILPVVEINDHIVSEGNPRLKDIVEFIEFLIENRKEDRSV